MQPRSKPDHYALRARREQYRARSAYKLLEALKRFPLVKKGGRVLDLGAAPGSWLQVVAREVGEKGVVLGVDIQVISPPLPAQVKVIKGDILNPGVLDAIRETAPAFDLVLSDLAPATSGVKLLDAQRSLALLEAAWHLARALLAPEGNFMAKVFEGPEMPALRKELSRDFINLKVFKPRASRKESREIYLVGLNFHFPVLPEPGKEA